MYFGKTQIFAFTNVKMDVLEYLSILGEFVFAGVNILQTAAFLAPEEFL